MTTVSAPRASARGTAARRVSRTVLVAAYAVPVMVAGGFAWFATAPVLIVLIGSLRATHSAALRALAILLAVVYAMPYALWQVRNPSRSMSEDISAASVAAVAAVAVAVIVAIHLERRRGAGAPATGTSGAAARAATTRRRIIVAAVSVTAAALMVVTGTATTA